VHQDFFSNSLVYKKTFGLIRELVFWGYANWSLGQSYTLQLGIIMIAIIIWLLLYLFGRLGKKKGKLQMEELYL
jgi:hypothetical protein